MKFAGLMLLVIAAWAFPYHKVPGRWRDVFVTQWWR